MVCGISYRREEEFAAFLAPVLEKGFRAGKPAVFPNLLLSSPAGHASIYLELRGPVFTTTDLSLSMGTALASCADLLGPRRGQRGRRVHGRGARRDRGGRRRGPARSGPRFLAPPLSPGAAAFVLRVADEATAPPLAVVHEWQDGTSLATWAPSAPPADPALVVLPRPSDALSGRARSLAVGRRAARDREPPRGQQRGHRGHRAGRCDRRPRARRRARRARARLTGRSPARARAGPGRWAAITLLAP